MNFYQILVNLYAQFLAIFPPPLQWLVTLALIIGLIGAFIALLRHNILFVVLLIVLLPFIAPIVQRFLLDLYNFFLFLIQSLGSQAPKTP